MRICIVGKFPPIQGGVSMRTYWTAHRLAARGHDVQVVTNAKEVRPPYRMHMRAADWARCAGAYGAGRVEVHWTDPVDRAQRMVPMASAFVSKLAGIAARLHAEAPFDVVFSHYLEPYGVAGHLAAEIAGVPHVVRLAGSDAGRLWHHPQFEPLYDHVLRSAEAVVTVGAVAQRAAAHGVDPARIVPGGGFAVPDDLFAPEGPALDFVALTDEVRASDLAELVWGGFAADRPYFGVYGKLGETKGSFALLAALERIVAAGHDLGLVAMAHGAPPVARRFREAARRRGLEGRILQIPFLPHWRVPELLRSCRAVCCLEQRFPIAFHNPIVAREVLLAGTCLVASAEMVRRLPEPERLAHGYNCLAVRDVDDAAELADALAMAASDPRATSAIGARGREAALEMQRDIDFPHRIERILTAAAQRAPVASKRPSQAASPPMPESIPQAATSDVGDGFDPLFRLAARRAPDAPDEWRALMAVRDSRARLHRLDGADGEPVVTFGAARNPLMVDEETARILALCDGRRTIGEIVAEIEGAADGTGVAARIDWIRHLFALGLIGVRERDPAAAPSN